MMVGKQITFVMDVKNRYAIDAGIRPGDITYVINASKITFALVAGKLKLTSIIATAAAN